MSSTLIGGFLRDRPTGRTADSDSANRGSNPRLSVIGNYRNVAQWPKHWSYKPAVVGSILTVPILDFGIVAKLERRQSHKLVIMGSNPTGSIFWDARLFWQ